MTDCGLKTETRYGKLPFGLSSENSTVLASVALADLSSMTPFSPAFPAVTRRPIVATTSSAVKSDPSCHFTPVRSLNVQTEASAFGLQSVARPLSMSSPDLFNVARYSKDWETTP